MRPIAVVKICQSFLAPVADSGDREFKFAAEDPASASRRRLPLQSLGRLQIPKLIAYRHVTCMAKFPVDERPKTPGLAALASNRNQDVNLTKISLMLLMILIAHRL
jgi:hypothetical protein